MTRGKRLQAAFLANRGTDEEVLKAPVQPQGQEAPRRETSRKSLKGSTSSELGLLSKRKAETNQAPARIPAKRLRTADDEAQSRPQRQAQNLRSRPVAAPAPPPLPENTQALKDVHGRRDLKNVLQAQRQEQQKKEAAPARPEAPVHADRTAAAAGPPRTALGSQILVDHAYAAFLRGGGHRSQERRLPSRAYLRPSAAHFTASNRMHLVSWIASRQAELFVQDETIHLAVRLTDAFLANREPEVFLCRHPSPADVSETRAESTQFPCSSLPARLPAASPTFLELQHTAPPPKLQRLGATALFVAAKLHELQHMKMPSYRFAEASEAAGFGREQLILAERALLKDLNYKLYLPTAPSFANAYYEHLKPRLLARGKGEKAQEDALKKLLVNEAAAVKFTLDVALMSHAALDFQPSLLAAAAVLLASGSLARLEGGEPLEGGLVPVTHGERTALGELRQEAPGEASASRPRRSARRSTRSALPAPTLPADEDKENLAPPSLDMPAVRRLFATGSLLFTDPAAVLATTGYALEDIRPVAIFLASLVLDACHVPHVPLVHKWFDADTRRFEMPQTQALLLFLGAMGDLGRTLGLRNAFLPAAFFQEAAPGDLGYAPLTRLAIEHRHEFCGLMARGVALSTSDQEALDAKAKELFTREEEARGQVNAHDYAFLVARPVLAA